MPCRGCAHTRRLQQQQKAYGMMAESKTVQIPQEVAADLREAIVLMRSAALRLQPWMDEQPPATKLIVQRAISWGARWIGLMEPLIVQAGD